MGISMYGPFKVFAHSLEQVSSGLKDLIMNYDYNDDTEDLRYECGLIDEINPSHFCYVWGNNEVKITYFVGSQLIDGVLPIISPNTRFFATLKNTPAQNLKQFQNALIAHIFIENGIIFKNNLQYTIYDTETLIGLQKGYDLKKMIEESYNNLPDIMRAIYFDSLCNFTVNTIRRNFEVTGTSNCEEELSGLTKTIKRYFQVLNSLKLGGKNE